MKTITLILVSLISVSIFASTNNCEIGIKINAELLDFRYNVENQSILDSVEETAKDELTKRGYTVVEADQANKNVFIKVYDAVPEANTLRKSLVTKFGDSFGGIEVHTKESNKLFQGIGAQRFVVGEYDMDQNKYITALKTAIKHVGKCN